MWKKFKQIFNKENFNYSTGDVNPLEFHTIVYFVTKAYGVADEFVPAWTKYFLAFMLCCVTPALTFCVLCLFHAFQIFDIDLIIQVGIYTIVLTYKVCILSCVKLNIPNFHALLRILREDFKYACTDGIRYRERFFENQILTWKISMFVVIIMSSLCVGIALTAVLTLVYFLLTHDSESDEERPLFFPFWAFDVDFKKTPNYEIALIYSEISVLAYGYNYIFMIATQVLWVREVATKIDLMTWALQDLLEDIHPTKDQYEAEMFSNIIKKRMRIIIQQHHSMYDLLENYGQVYMKLLIYEQVFCGPVVCLTAFSTSKKVGPSDVDYVLVILCICAVLVAFIPSYMCSYLRIKVSSVLDACWDTSFWNAGPVIRPYLVLMMHRSLRPLPLSANGFEEVSVQTFANKMTSAYSCFNMLRQAF